MKMKRSVVVLFCAAALACETTDLNTPCTLVKRNPDGGAASPLLKSDPIIKKQANKAFHLLGQTQ